MNPLDQIMSVEQAAELWKLHPSYVKNLCAQGRLKAIKLGKTWIIDRRQPNPSVRDALEYSPRDNEPLTEEEQQQICQADADFESR